MNSFLKLLVTVGIGTVLGFLAVGLAICTETLKTWKNTTARGIIHDGAPHGILRAALFHCGYSTVLILIGSCLVGLEHMSTPAAAVLRTLTAGCIATALLPVDIKWQLLWVQWYTSGTVPAPKMHHAGKCCHAGTILGTCCCGCWRLTSHGLPQWGGHSRPAQPPDSHRQVRTAALHCIALQLHTAILPAASSLGRRKSAYEYSAGRLEQAEVARGQALPANPSRCWRAGGWGRAAL